MSSEEFAKALKAIIVHIARPSTTRPAGSSSEGYYKVVGDEVWMSQPRARSIPPTYCQNGVGTSYRRQPLPRRSASARLTKEIRGALKTTVADRPEGFGSPIHYPRAGFV
jgi:hypothetical protein